MKNLTRSLLVLCSHLPIPFVVETQRLDFENIWRSTISSVCPRQTGVNIRIQTLREQVGLLLLSQKGKECKSSFPFFLSCLCAPSENILLSCCHSALSNKLFLKVTFQGHLKNHPKPSARKEVGLFRWHRCLPWIYLRVWKDCKVLTGQGESKRRSSKVNPV